jgi:glutathione S-transferase
MWDTLGTVSVPRLTDARLQLHWAAQAAAAVGKQLVEHRPDYGEQSFQWQPASRALVQGLVHGSRPFRSAVRPSPPALLLLDDDGGILRECPLDGRTLDEAYAWLEAEVPALERPLERPVELPAHPFATGARFSAADAEAFAELAGWLEAAHGTLSAVARRNPGASDVRLWPHHFDVATLISLEGERSIGIGVVPGDSWKAEPYVYVTPWPYPQGAELPPMDGGSWNTEGWTGAYLEASRIQDGEQVERFVDSAVAACRRLLER